MDNPQLQWSGIDTLKLGIGAHWPETTHEMLIETLTQAQATARADEPTKWELLAGTFIPQPYGRKKYKFGLADQSSQFYFTSEPKPDGHTPNIWLELGPRFTTIRDIDQTDGHARCTLEELGATIDWIKPSELHLTCDISADRPQDYSDYFDTAHQPKWTTRARTLHAIEREELAMPEQMISKGRRLEYFRIGSGPLQLRIYNKTQELKIHSEKLWENLLWKNPLADNVTRVEFQIRREKLNDFNIQTLENLKNVDELWAYLTQNWFRLNTKATKHGNATPITQFWQTATDAKPKAEARKPIKKVTPNALERVNQGMGNITSALAQLYPETPDISEARIMTTILQLWKQTCKSSQPKLWDAVNNRREKIKMKLRAHTIADQPPTNEKTTTGGDTPELKRENQPKKATKRVEGGMLLVIPRPTGGDPATAGSPAAE